MTRVALILVGLAVVWPLPGAILGPVAIIVAAGLGWLARRSWSRTRGGLVPLAGAA
jgi:hypothetical protein